jgi:hypothetical protein
MLSNSFKHEVNYEQTKNQPARGNSHWSGADPISSGIVRVHAFGKSD